METPTPKTQEPLDDSLFGPPPPALSRGLLTGVASFVILLLSVIAWNNNANVAIAEGVIVEANANVELAVKALAAKAPDEARNYLLLAKKTLAPYSPPQAASHSVHR